ncbi:hypothetical protein GCM10009613_60920 [Pseudonocardia kongjuensis]|uniref:Molecular chaperone DnaJ n=1 Tax=Pseudonocardia kongjuensis TaxID=102227 RepID=A0ABP4IXZ3_9PSEU
MTPERRSSGTFRAGWSATLDLLLKEIEHLDPVGAVALRVDAPPDDIRLDGMLRARARVDFPGVVVSFTSASKGPLSFSTDMYEQRYYNDLPGWQANVRAIALSLEALRAVDRHGATSRGEQYVGWRQIESGPRPAPGPFDSPDEALRWMRDQAHADIGLRARDLFGEALFRTLARRMHPDMQGEQSAWARLDAARLMLKGSNLW